MNFTYLSRCETAMLDFAQYPSEELILKLAKALEADQDKLLIPAKKVHPTIRERVFERPEAFSKLACLDDALLDQVMAQVNRLERKATGPSAPRREQPTLSGPLLDPNLTLPHA